MRIQPKNSVNHNLVKDLFEGLYKLAKLYSKSEDPNLNMGYLTNSIFF